MKNIKQAAVEAVGEKKINSNGQFLNRKTTWFCEEIKELTENKRRASMIYKSPQTAKLYNEYK